MALRTVPAPDILPATMPDLRDAVRAEMKRREWKTYRLVKELKGKRPNGGDVPHMTVYQFIRGDGPINSDDLGLIFDVLDLEVSPRTGKAKRKGHK
jgi:hypothetical protein